MVAPLYRDTDIILAAEGVSKSFDGFKAINDLNFYLTEGELSACALGGFRVPARATFDAAENVPTLWVLLSYGITSADKRRNSLLTMPTFVCNV